MSLLPASGLGLGLGLPLLLRSGAIHVENAATSHQLEDSTLVAARKPQVAESERM
jgi:hypothetical protein